MSITTALHGVISAIEVGQEIYQHVTKTMDSMQNSGESGASKKASVMLVVRDFVIDLGKNWDSWSKYISDFIDAAKAIYNSVKKILK